MPSFHSACFSLVLEMLFMKGSHYLREKGSYLKQDQGFICMDLEKFCRMSGVYGFAGPNYKH